MTTRTKSIAALITATLLWSSLVVVARATVGTVSPMAILLLRLLVASIAFLPFFIKSKCYQKKHFLKLAAVSLLTTVNLAFFMLGIQYTTASMSQIIYAAMPILVIIIGFIFSNQSFDFHKIAGVSIGLLGILLIVYFSAMTKNQTIIGSLRGNLLIIIAMIGWLGFLLLSKSLAKNFSPVDISSTSIIISFFVVLILAGGEYISGNFRFPLTFPILTSGAYMGFFGTFLPYLLYQFVIKNTASLTATMSTYIQPVMTAIMEIIFLGAQLTVPFIAGSTLVFTGIFLATTFEIYHRRKKNQLLSR
jgi:drug/metabolite transporter (DMT)-like permease